MKERGTTAMSVAVVVSLLLGAAWYRSLLFADGITFTIKATTLGFSNFNGNLVTWVDLPSSSNQAGTGVAPFHNKTNYNDTLKRRPFGKPTFDGRGTYSQGVVIGIPHWIFISAALIWGGLVFLRQWQNIKGTDAEQE